MAREAQIAGPNNDSVVALNRSVETLDELIVEARARDEYISDGDFGAAVRGHSVALQLGYFRMALLERIATLAPKEHMDQIREEVHAKVHDPQVRQYLSNLVLEFSRQQQELAAKLQAQEDAEGKELRRIELQERKWHMRKSLLDREPAAVLVGGLLLLLMTSALIIAMFLHTPVPETVTSAFLLILGFFFGQTMSARNRHDRE